MSEDREVGAGRSSPKPAQSSDLFQDVLILLEDPESGSQPAKATDRRKKYRSLRRFTEDRREKIGALLEKQGVEDQVQLGESTAFSMLVARATPKAIECLKSSNLVKDVIPIGDVTIETLRD